MSVSFQAIAVAGGVASAEFSAQTGVQNRALVQLAQDKTMLNFVLAALLSATHVSGVTVVGDIPAEQIQRHGDKVKLVKPGDSLIDNILIGLAAVGSKPGDRVLMVGADIPFISAEAVDDFVMQASATSADFCYPIIPMADYNREFAGMKRTTLKLREGEFTGGNIMLCRAGVLTANPDAIRAAYAGRKSVMKIGAMLGWGLLLRIAVSQLAAPGLLNIPLLEKAIGNLLGTGVRASAVITKHASIGTDVDKPEDVEYAREWFAKRGCSSA